MSPKIASLDSDGRMRPKNLPTWLAETAIATIAKAASDAAAAAAAEKATSQSLDLIRKQYTAGAINSTQVLIAQQSYLSAIVTSAGARANQYADTAALFQALGGGWWNRNDVRPPKPERDPAPFL